MKILKQFKLKAIVFSLFTVAAFNSSASIQASTSNLEVKKHTPSQSHSDTLNSIVDTLKNRHYKKQPIDDKLSLALFERYFNMLDPNKLYLIQSDVDKFNDFNLVIDDQLNAGELDFGFIVFSYYQKQVSARIKKNLELISKYDFDFDKKESISLKDKKSDWKTNENELDNAWRKRIKFSLLNMTISGKTLDEAKDTLTTRYTYQLKRSSSQKSGDVFELYMNALTTLYDPHSNYFSPKAKDRFNIEMSLSLEGIGATLQVDENYVKVMSIIAAGPADKQGALKSGDKIVSVGEGEDGEMIDIVGARLDDSVNLIRGPKGTTVRLGVLSDDGLTKVINIVRNKIMLEEQSAKKKIITVNDNDKSYKVGVIDLPTFYLDSKAYLAKDPDFKSTSRDVAKLISELKEEGVDGLIMDLRENGGGSLFEASVLTDMFIDKGPIVQIKSFDQKIFSGNGGNRPAVYDGPLIVLIDRTSASASEIFAGAMQDYNRGIIVGTQSYGKGTVQEVMELNQGALKITNAKFYRVSGESTQHKGVMPDITFPSLVNKSVVGEGNLSTALPWDQIPNTEYQAYESKRPLISALDEKRIERFAEEPELKYLQLRSENILSKSKQKTFSLERAERIKAREIIDARELSLENMRQEAQGLKPYVSVKELRENAAARKKNVESIILNESAKVMVNYITLLKEAE